jgi:hypothetical protein
MQIKNKITESGKTNKILIISIVLFIIGLGFSLFFCFLPFILVQEGYSFWTYNGNATYLALSHFLYVVSISVCILPLYLLEKIKF